MTDQVLEFYSEYFIDPFLDQLIEQYPEKILQNKNKILLLLELVKTQLIFPLLALIDEDVEDNIQDKVISAIEGLWKTYNSKVDMSMFDKKKPEDHKLKDFCRKKFDEKVNNYYGDYPDKIDLSLDETNKTVIRHNINEALEIAIKFPSNDPILNFLSKYIIQNKEYIGDKVDYNVSKRNHNFSHCDFSGKDLSYKPIHTWIVNGSIFHGTKFKGNGNTGDCIHWQAKNCDFTGAIFEGKMCTKTSNYNGANFTGVDLTTLMYNISEVTMENCNFTDAFIYDKEGNKLIGKELLKYLDKTKFVSIKDSFYTSPVDGGYHSNALDETIWTVSI
jgi:hypothetical protein